MGVMGGFCHPESVLRSGSLLNNDLKTLKKMLARILKKNPKAWYFYTTFILRYSEHSENV